MNLKRERIRFSGSLDKVLRGKLRYVRSKKDRDDQIRPASPVTVSGLAAADFILSVKLAGQKSKRPFSSWILGFDRVVTRDVAKGVVDSFLDFAFAGVDRHCIASHVTLHEKVDSDTLERTSDVHLLLASRLLIHDRIFHPWGVGKADAHGFRMWEDWVNLRQNWPSPRALDRARWFVPKSRPSDTPWSRRLKRQVGAELEEVFAAGGLATACEVLDRLTAMDRFLEVERKGGGIEVVCRNGHGPVEAGGEPETPCFFSGFIFSPDYKVDQLPEKILQRPVTLPKEVTQEMEWLMSERIKRHGRVLGPKIVPAVEPSRFLFQNHNVPAPSIRTARTRTPLGRLGERLGELERTMRGIRETAGEVVALGADGFAEEVELDSGGRVLEDARRRARGMAGRSRGKPSSNNRPLADDGVDRGAVEPIFRRIGEDIGRLRAGVEALRSGPGYGSTAGNARTSDRELDSGPSAPRPVSGKAGTADARLTRGPVWRIWDYERVVEILHQRARDPSQLSTGARRVFTHDFQNMNWRWLRFRARLSIAEENRITRLFEKLMEQERAKEAKKDRPQGLDRL